MKAYSKDCVQDKETTYFRKGVGELLHMMIWSKPEIYNKVRDLSRHMNGVTTYQIKAMHSVMNYVV